MLSDFSYVRIFINGTRYRQFTKWTHFILSYFIFESTGTAILKPQNFSPRLGIEPTFDDFFYNY
jgi:hypothetical protein